MTLQSKCVPTIHRNTANERETKIMVFSGAIIFELCFQKGKTRHELNVITLENIGRHNKIFRRRGDLAPVICRALLWELVQ
jgi:hypothetical protein